jgi:hypothetical protein
VTASVQTVKVSDTGRYIADVVEGWADRVPMQGRDGASDIYVAGGLVVKTRPMRPFRALLLADAFRDVHTALAPRFLAPVLRLACYDATTLCTAYEFVPAVRPAASISPELIGCVPKSVFESELVSSR